MGGFAKAFQKVGADVVWANEIDRFAVETFRLNFPTVRCVHKPVEDLTVRGDKLEPVDILTAGFPCQPFSVAGDKLGFKDVRGMLFLEIIRILREFGKKKPAILLLENVRHFRTHDKGRTFKRVQSEIQRAGYWFSEKDAQVLNTSTHTKIPQNRDRVFMVAMNTDLFSSNTFEFPDPLPDGSVKPVRDFLDLDKKAPAECYFQPSSQYYALFVEAMASGDPRAVYQLRRNYVRENMSGECFTIMANIGDGGHNDPVIKDRWGIRKLTRRECARLQGYDDSFKFPPNMSRAQLGKQIGNSVTVPLVVRLAKSCLAELRKLDAAERTAS
ncbi:MAG: (cytosine-5-)-methyltransferase [Gemmatimonadetes bacterium]|nr:(cytosine-5-)-methyltransferase [Gemmatimonadota bacterium]